MSKHQSLRPPGRREWLRRLDRFAADLNVVLVMFAFGLGMLDLTLLFSERIIHRFPATHAVSANKALAEPAAAVVRAELP